MGTTAGNRIMTPTEALVVQRALHKTIFVALPHRYNGDADPFCEHLTSTFLAVLPDGWRLRGPDDVTVTDMLAEALRGLAHDTSSGPCWCRKAGDRGKCIRAGRALAALSADKEGQK